MTLWTPCAIGTIRTPIADLEHAPRQGASGADLPGEVLVDPAYAEGLAELEGFSHVMLIFHFHHAEGFALTVLPRGEGAPRGLFATRAPRRPNPIGVTVVRIVAVEGCTLRVRGVDMLDGTPLLDIKPYFPAIDGPEPVRIGWLEGQPRGPAPNAGPDSDPDAG